jgi:hypothetical protein
MKLEQEKPCQPDGDVGAEDAVLQKIKIDLHQQLLDVLDFNEARNMYFCGTPMSVTYWSTVRLKST